MFLLVIIAFATILHAQKNNTFCDPELQNEIRAISIMGGTFLKEFLITPDDLEKDIKSPMAYSFLVVLSKGCTYRVYFKNLSKFTSEATLNLLGANSEQIPMLPDYNSILNIHRKNNEAVSFRDIEIKYTGPYKLIVSFQNNERACALVVLSFIARESVKKENDTSKVYEVVDEVAQFKGGDLNKFRNYVAENYHANPAEKKDITGNITVKFVVNSFGKVQDVVILKSCGNINLDNEGIRVIRSSPLWKPAKVGNINVKQQFIIPIKLN